ncbi:uncharacterized protein LOC115222213 [Octopus sinensis]|uniref:Uncharacterized protein LOC115222213 n=1 Tax=Octopus sinensis TaxID=2607531 RepID=A0A6P7TFM1_9MOLL|nr:uncharacterized protein LOC115222213 [Octopus sinensis]XP_029648225.1 uncharacterized protein LOC115222213 [Octopus sinensis]XP_029648226.1 uncharacterized protein LOC115222213 [Octopus sinensis]XP_036367297.1 uncharacterized protein LOC115222213 [Octopus sinensis]XP_036367298.1 uncharacterized protein LOC115222213 [Octopus sinensis]XP_036367299.1 uncharacterized protein LOC115222213 [Octopus sinensis]XP_036367300.1 uncharacterized protein LOC115222213 [Octopus sinensis]XP_036367301.1 unc
MYPWRLSQRLQLYVKHLFIDCSLKEVLKKVFPFISAIIFMALLPFIQIGIYHKIFWVPNKIPVDRSTCTCSCFDTIFRGSYEGQKNIRYKHIYFNSTQETYAVWIITLFFVLITYESIKYIYNTLFPQLHVRLEMLFLFAINIYPHYYSWWCLFSYINEGFYLYFSHHTFFIITELIVSAFVLNMCDSRNPVTFKKIFFILCICSTHILVNGADQFVIQVIFKQGKAFQNLRNVGLMIPDLAHLFMCCHKLIQLKRSNVSPASVFSYKEGVGLAFLFIFVGTLFGNWI